MAERLMDTLPVQETKSPPSKFAVKRKTVILIIIFVLCVITALVIGAVIGVARAGAKMEKMMKMKRRARTKQMHQRAMARAKAHQDVLDGLEASNIRENLRYFSKKPHTAGMARNNELGEEIHRRFQSYGFKSERVSYNVLLSYPRKDKPNYAHILGGDGKANFTTQKMENFLEPGEKTNEAVQPFNAYSPAKTVQGDLVYVNYGRYEDFKDLKEKFNVSCQGKIVIVRYGKIFRGNKVKNAQKNGAIGVLIYSDPQDYGPVPDNQLFPNSWWLSRDGVQRGSVDRGDADPLTPGYPSTDQAYRITPNSKNSELPQIPSHPISAQDALQFLSKLGGKEIKRKDWKGNLSIKYRTGPGFAAPHQNMKVKVEVHNERKQMKITNIIGTLKGSVEPDRYVLVGNHRDAWVFGAVDASSGTAVMMEMARSLAEQVKKGWRPRRSIVFCSWDGEEHDIIGSSEWVEQHIKFLQDRAVAYLNMDTSVSGNHSLGAAASPLLYKAILDATSKTMDPIDSMTVLEKYKKVFPSKTRPGEPQISGLGSGSDFLKFYQLAGVPSVDLTYSSKDAGAFRWFYPVYHSLHDTFYWVSKFSDPTFKVHLTVAHVATRCIINIADSSLIPWNANDYAIELKNGAKKLKDILAKAGGSKFNVTTNYLVSAIEDFEKVAKNFHEQLKSKDMSNVLTLRMINDRLMQLEKGFILPEGLPGRPYIKHLVYAPGLYNSYGTSLFSGVTDQLFGIEKNPEKWETVKRQLTILATRIESVTETLKDDM